MRARERRLRAHARVERRVAESPPRVRRVRRVRRSRTRARTNAECRSRIARAHVARLRLQTRARDARGRGAREDVV